MSPLGRLWLRHVSTAPALAKACLHTLVHCVRIQSPQETKETHTHDRSRTLSANLGFRCFERRVVDSRKHSSPCRRTALMRPATWLLKRLALRVVGLLEFLKWRTRLVRKCVSRVRTKRGAPKLTYDTEVRFAGRYHMSSGS